MDGLTIFLLVLLAYFVFIAVFSRTKAFEKYNFSLSGPLLMWRTERGRGFIDKIARNKPFWSWFGIVSIIICIAVMVVAMALLIMSSGVAFTLTREQAIEPQYIIGFPGINPMIPIGYGVVALIIAIVLHEFMHGILARANDVKVKSLGAVFFILPIGAFTEPDDEEIKQMPRKKRMKLYAAGPGSNIILSVIFVLLFATFMGAAVPSVDGVVVASVVPDFPADDAGIKPGMQIVSIGNTSVKTLEDVAGTKYVAPGERVAVKVYYENEFRTIENVTSGVVVTSASAGYPASNAGIEPGLIFSWIKFTYENESLNLTIANLNDFTNALALTSAGQTATLGMYAQDLELQTFTVTLANKYEYYATYNPTLNSEEFRGKGFLGVTTSYLGAGFGDVDTILQSLAHPYQGVNTFNEFLQATIYYLLLPFPTIGLSPLPTYITDLYEIEGPLAFIPADAFWILTNTFYWIFWINLMLGLTNALPAVPLDGGYILRDGIATLVHRIKKDLKPERVEGIIISVTRAISVLVLFLILAPVVVPYLIG